MSDLAEFLLARIAEDEAVAASARGLIVHGENTETLAYVKRFDTARVLAECEAKRRIVENHAQRFRAEGEHHDAHTLRLLALPYADHPDYRDE